MNVSEIQMQETDEFVKIRLLFFLSNIIRRGKKKEKRTETVSLVKTCC